jgi:putative ABC transport system permease protein
MLTYALSATWRRKRRLAAIALAVVLGVAFLTATLVVGDSASAGFRVAFDTANAGTDAYVRSSRQLTGGRETVRPPIGVEVLDLVAQVDGVADVVPSIDGVGQVLDADGHPSGGGGPTLARNWIDDPELTGWDLAAGRGPVAAGEVVVDRATAEEAGLAPGDTATVLVPDPIEVTVVGIAAFGDRDSIGNATFVAFTTEEAQRLVLGTTDRVSAVVVAGVDGIGQDELADRVARALPQGIEALTGAELTAEQQAEVEGNLVDALTTALLVFAFVALVVAAFSIFNTFSILAAQRGRESGLLRALGASRRQVLTAALAESALVGAVGSVLGVGTGLLMASGLLAVLDAVGFGLPTDGLRLAGGNLAAVVAIGTVVTVASALVPAWRAARVAPLAALRDVEIDATASSRPRVGAGLAAVGAGIGLVLSASWSASATGDGEMARAGAGTVALVVGLVLLGPVVARPVGGLLGAPLALRGVSGDLARRNAVRNPRRTAATASALLIGVGVVSLFTVFGASVKRSIDDAVSRSFGGDLALEPAGSSSNGAGLAPGVVDAVAALPEVDVATGLGFGGATLDGAQRDVTFADLDDLPAVADLDVVAGDLASMGDDAIAVSSGHAADRAWGLGDRVEMGFADGTTATLTVAAVYDAENLAGGTLVTRSLWEAHNEQPSFFVAFVDLADGVGADEGRDAVAAATRGTGGPDILDRDEFVESQAAEVDTLLNVIYGLLGVAILIALMGIANTLSLSVHERTRELGMLRALGQTQSQLRAMVRWESVVVATFGAVGGIGLGLFLGWGMVRALTARTELATFAVPVGPLLVVLVAGVLVGIVAGIRPARRASRLDVLTAIDTP